MQLLVAFFLLFGLLAFPAKAQDADSSVFEITDVGVDVTASSAAKARDQAVVEAQRTAFHRLMERIGARASFGATINDDDIAALVQSFEVQDERTSSVRYIGTFTVQFKPNTLRGLLAKDNVGYVETRGKLTVVLPVYNGGGKAVLWEEPTKWRAAWQKTSPMNGLVPVIIPVGDAEDTGILNAADAVNGKPGIKSMIDRYQAGGAVVAVCETNLDQPGKEISVNVTRYDNEGNPATPQRISVPLGDGKDAVDAALAEAVRQVRVALDAGWRAQAGETSPEASPLTITSSPTATPAATPAPVAATARLPVSVPIRSLADWAAIKKRLDSVPTIAHTDLITLARGSSSIEIEFRGDIPQLQAALRQQNLTLVQDLGTNAWVLQSPPGGPL